MAGKKKQGALTFEGKVVGVAIALIFGSLTLHLTKISFATIIGFSVPLIIIGSLFLAERQLGKED